MFLVTNENMGLCLSMPRYFEHKHTGPKIVTAASSKALHTYLKFMSLGH